MHKNKEPVSIDEFLISRIYKGKNVNYYIYILIISYLFIFVNKKFTFSPNLLPINRIGTWLDIRLPSVKAHIRIDLPALHI